MKFDPDRDYAKHRDAHGGVWFMQDGQRFTVRGKHLGKAGGTSRPPNEASKKKHSEVRERANEKLKNFSNVVESSSPVAEALKENRAAAAAEAGAGE